jgi:hypothetical protein
VFSTAVLEISAQIARKSRWLTRVGLSLHRPAKGAAKKIQAGVSGLSDRSAVSPDAPSMYVLAGVP